MNRNHADRNDLNRNRNSNEVNSHLLNRHDSNRNDVDINSRSRVNGNRTAAQDTNAQVDIVDPPTPAPSTTTPLELDRAYSLAENGRRVHNVSNPEFVDLTSAKIT
jgi:hypothetical protein